MIISILIPSLVDRQAKLRLLVSTLRDQIADKSQVQILTLADNREKTTGRKRNELLKAATGEYVAFVDDDDRISPDYISSILAALECKPDCVGFKGWYYHRRRQHEWYISNALPYVDAMIGGKTVYLRHTNHLAPVRREIALQIGFPDAYHKEDHDYAVRLRESGLIKTEAFINKHLYHYLK